MPTARSPEHELDPLAVEVEVLVLNVDHMDLMVVAWIGYSGVGIGLQVECWLEVVFF